MNKTQFSDKEFANGIDCYDPEKRVFPEIAKRKKKTLNAFELLLILRWKLGRMQTTNSGIVSQLSKINNCIRNAGEDGEEIAAITSLCEIKGIKLAVASAILTVCYPEKFTIIDRRVLETLEMRPPDSARWTAEKYWEKFVPAVKACSNGLPLRETDQALWGISVYHDIERIMKSVS